MANNGRMLPSDYQSALSAVRNAALVLRLVDLEKVIELAEGNGEDFELIKLALPLYREAVRRNLTVLASPKTHDAPRIVKRSIHQAKLTPRAP